MLLSLALECLRRRMCSRLLKVFVLLRILLPGSTGFAEELAVPEVHEIEFAMEPASEPSSVYGVSALLECLACDAQSYIDVEIGQLNQDGSRQKVMSYRSYTHGKLEKQFYNLMSVNKNHRFYENSEQALQLSLGSNYVVNLRSSSPVTYFIEKNPNANLSPDSKIRQSRYVKWFSQPYMSMFYGTPLSTIEKPFLEIVAYLAVTVLQFFVIGCVVLLAFRKQVLAPENKKAAIIAFLATAASFLLYFITLCTDHPGGDSREFQLAQLGFRELHQPGDPILAMAAAIFGKLFPFGSFMYKGHLLAAILSSMSVGFFSAGLYLFSGSIKASLLPAGILATGAAFWNYGVIAQNYSMSAFFQALMLFFTFNARSKPNPLNFILACLLAFLMLTTHPTNAYWFFFCAICILPIIKFVDNKIKTLATAAMVVAAAIVLVYLPYILIVKNPGYFRPVIVFLNENQQFVERGPSAKFIAFSIDGFRSFIRYVLGNSESQSWTGGIVTIAGSKDIFSILASEWLKPYKVLAFGFGILPALLGVSGMVKLMLPKSTRAVAIGLTLTFFINFVINICEILYFKVGYVEIYAVHIFPMFFVLSIGMAALLMPAVSTLSNRTV
jgi:hypothetical protein